MPLLSVLEAFPFGSLEMMLFLAKKEQFVNKTEIRYDLLKISIMINYAFLK